MSHSSKAYLKDVYHGKSVVHDVGTAYSVLTIIFLLQNLSTNKWKQNVIKSKEKFILIHITCDSSKLAA